MAESVVFNGADEVLYFRRMMDISLNEVYSLIILFLAILQATCDGLKTEEVRSQLLLLSVYISYERESFYPKKWNWAQAVIGDAG